MSKNKHPKLKKANKMLTKQEREWGIRPFDSFAWQDRKRKMKEKQANQGVKKEKKPSNWVSKRSLKRKNNGN